MQAQACSYMNLNLNKSETVLNFWIRSNISNNPLSTKKLSDTFDFAPFVENLQKCTANYPET